MLFFDMFFYTVFQKKRKDMDSAMFSACSIMSFLIGLFIGMIADIIGLIKDNPVSRWASDNTFLAVTPIAITFNILFIIRYFKYVSVENIEKKISVLPDNKRIFIKTVIFIFIITVPVGTFVFYRLYMYGYV
jgi:hypothetical protein